MLAGVEVNQSWWLSMGLTINRQRMCWFNPLRVKFLGSSKGEDPPLTLHSLVPLVPIRTWA